MVTSSGDDHEQGDPKQVDVSPAIYLIIEFIHCLVDLLLLFPWNSPHDLENQIPPPGRPIPTDDDDGIAYQSVPAQQRARDSKQNF